jgi:lysophospholipase L1-like esterase
MPRRRIVRPLAWIAALCFAPLLAELALRRAHFWYPPVPAPILWNPVEDRDLRLELGYHRVDRDAFWAPRPRASLPWADGESVNAAGFRGPRVERARTGGERRVVVLGDSSTFGLLVRYDETFCAELARRLTELGSATEVLDCGVVGYSTHQMLARYRSFARAFAPDDVVVAVGGVNDHFPALQFVDDVAKAARPVELGGALEQRALDWRRSLRLAHATAWLVDRCVDGAAAERDRAFRRERWEAHLVRTFGASDWKGKRRVPLDAFAANLAALASEARAGGARVWFLSMPRHPELERTSPVLALYTAALEDTARALDVPVIDGRGAFARRLAHGEAPALLWAADLEHPNAAGHAELAARLAEALAPPR